jgi:hypothetical protein
MSNVKSMRVILAVLIAALLAVSAGCGESGSPGGAASAVPEDVAAYVSVDTSFEGDQWRVASELLARFPDGEGALEELLDEAELRDALGPEAVFTVLSGPMGADGEPPVVMLTQPDDPDAFDQLLEDSDAARAEVRGWQVVAYDEEVLDRYREALEGPSLEGSDAFAEAMDDLPGDALARVYANGEALIETLPELSAELGQAPLGLVEGEAGGSIGAALRAEGDGVRVDGRLVPTGEEEVPAPEAYETELVDEVPAEAIAFFSFNDLGAALERYSGLLGGGALLPFDLGEVGTLLAGETAVYLSPGGGVTLITEVEDEAAALETVEALVGLAGKDVPIAFDAFDGLLAVSSSEHELDALRADGPRLGQDDRFEEALDDAGMPDETIGFGYVDVEPAAPLFLERATGADEQLEPLGDAVFWGVATEDVQRFALFVGID